MTTQNFPENKLAQSKSSYLLQHKNNPVHWHPWGAEALSLAKTEQKPILLSIGYASCHWCHVMAHESFEDPATADLMNSLFVNIKVDREERPDLDEIYMEAVQMMTHHGGWPLTVFLTPDLKPFFGGTYFPPAPKYGQPSFSQVLLSVSHFYKERKEDVAAKSEEIANLMSSFAKETSLVKLEEALSDKNLTIDKIAQFMLEKYNDVLDILEHSKDNQHGGFGGAPKFPQPSKISAFLFSDNKAKRAHAIFTLNCICSGGINDQLGGGFSRYSVDSQWLVPHFEKMLYDNAQLLPLLGAASLITSSNPVLSNSFKNHAEKTVRYLKRDLMCSENGLFFSGEDADSEGEEGLFYIFSYSEVSEIFQDDPELLNFARLFYKVTPSGNFEGSNILTLPQEREKFCRHLGISLEKCTELEEKARQKLYALRSGRVRPGRDEKMILGWNALLATGLLQGALFLNDKSLFHDGLTLVKKLVQKFKNGQSISHVLYHHSPKEHKGDDFIFAFLDDIAFLMEACSEALCLTGCRSLAGEIYDLCDIIFSHFLDQKEGVLYYTRENTQLINRPMKLEDNVIYSANSAILNAFLKCKTWFSMQQKEEDLNSTEFKKLESIALVAVSNSAALIAKVPSAGANFLQKIKWLETQKSAFVKNEKDHTDFSNIANLMQEYQKNQSTLLFVGCSENSIYDLSDLEKYAIDGNKNSLYSYCDAMGCHIETRDVSTLF